jgi:hypothetical protein
MRPPGVTAAPDAAGVPCVDQKKSDGAGGVDREASYARIDATVALLAAVRVAGVGAQSADTLGDRCQSAEDLADVVLLGVSAARTSPRLLRLLRHRRELAAIVADIGDLVSDDQVMLGVDSGLEL